MVPNDCHTLNVKGASYGSVEDVHDAACETLES